MKLKFLMKILSAGLFMTIFPLSWASPVIELVVPTAPGGAVDTTARAISRAMTARGIDHQISYMPGAAGEIAIAHTLKKQNNVIFVGSSATFVFLDVLTNQKMRVTENMQLLGPTVKNAMGFVVAPNTQFKDFADLINQAKKQEMPCGVSNAHGEILLMKINLEHGTKFLPVMYKGTGQMLPNVVGGQLICAFDQTAPYSSQGDRVRWLAISEREAALPNVPMMSTLLVGFRYETWYGTGIPNNSNLLSQQELVSILRSWHTDKEIVQPLLSQGFSLANVPANLNRRTQDEIDAYLKIVSKK